MLRWAFPGAIFYAHDGQGGVARYDVVKLELGYSPGEHSKATIELSKKPLKYFASPLLRMSVSPKESWGEKLFALDTGGFLVLELGRLNMFLSLFYMHFFYHSFFNFNLFSNKNQFGEESRQSCMAMNPKQANSRPPRPSNTIPPIATRTRHLAFASH